MAVPKKRTGHSAQGHRRSNWKATKPETTTCTKCGAIVLTHTVCTACGYYKGKAVSIKSADYIETAAEPKKTTKAKSKKQNVKSEAEAVETKETAKVVEPEEVVKTRKNKKEEAKSEE
ncbi:MAG: 50S ribosomal protein L32 [Candidatus Gastranaerophilales bacterium]|nr:50S ribosomal protein L32 [Candidatus Gastranaerophilales bacterium]